VNKMAIRKTFWRVLPALMVGAIAVVIVGLYGVGRPRRSERRTAKPDTPPPAPQLSLGHLAESAEVSLVATRAAPSASASPAQPRHLRITPAPPTRRARIPAGAFVAVALGLIASGGLALVSVIGRPSDASASITTYKLTASADAYVSSAQPAKNYGLSSRVRTDASPDMRGYLRFDVPALDGPISSATLLVYAVSKAQGFSVMPVSDDTWGETTITYTNAPVTGGAPVGSAPSSLSGTWTSVDVTSLVTGSGLVSMAIETQSTTPSAYASRESGTNAPQLILATWSSPTDTPVPPTPTATSAPPTATDTAVPRTDIPVTTIAPSTNAPTATETSTPTMPVPPTAANTPATNTPVTPVPATSTPTPTATATRVGPTPAITSVGPTPTSSANPAEPVGEVVPVGVSISSPLGHYGIFTMRVDGTDLRRIYVGDSMRNHVHVHGQRIVFSEYLQDVNGDGLMNEADLASSQVSVMNLDGTGYQAIAHRDGYNIVPVWSPDGNAVLFSSDRDNQSGFLDLFVFDLANGALRNLTATNDALEGDPDWVGNSIVFNRLRSDGVARLWMMNADGTGQRQLTNPSYPTQSTGLYPFGDFDPKLSPDGHYVVFERHLDNDLVWNGMSLGNWGIYVLDLATGEERLLAGGHGVDVVPTWSPDGQQVVYWEMYPQHGTLFIVPLSGGTPRQLFAARPDLQAEQPDWYVENGETRLIFSAYSQ
jgi:WD40-like Beta Propeller Repeat